MWNLCGISKRIVVKYDYCGGGGVDNMLMYIMDITRNEKQVKISKLADFYDEDSSLPKMLAP